MTSDALPPRLEPMTPDSPASQIFYGTLRPLDPPSSSMLPTRPLLDLRRYKLLQIFLAAKLVFVLRTDNFSPKKGPQ